LQINSRIFRIFAGKYSTKDEFIMTREAKVQYWLDIANYDIDTAETL